MPVTNPASLLPPDLMAQLERLELVTRKVFRGRLKGERRSKRKGQSVEFADFRGYVPGDDLRTLDWNLFARLDKLEERLGSNRYLTGNRLTEADWRLFTTLVRFDPVYVGHFKCNIRRIADYPNLQGYLRELYQVPGVAETVDMRHIKEHYYRSHATINPTGVVPVGPELDLTAPHGRETL